MSADPFVADLESLRRRRSAKWQTFPADVLPMFVAEMDCELAPPIAAELRAAIDRSDVGYAMPAPALGASLAGFAERRWGWRLDPAQVTAVTDVGVGAVELLRLLTRPGDAVVINPPIYPPFFDWIDEVGARRVEVPLAETDSGYRLDLAALETAFAAGAAAYVLCNPHNPVGRVHSAVELAEVVRLAQQYGVLVISDEIHAALTLPGATFTPFLSLAGASAVGFSLESASKAWNLAGLKCAAIVTGSLEMRAIVDRVPPDARWRTGHLGVLATVAAFADGEPWLDDLLVALDARRHLLGELVASQLPGVAYRLPEASFLAWLDCRGLDLEAPRELFLNRGRVALEDGVRFGAPGRGFVRLNYATTPELVVEGVARMAQALAGVDR